jgi:uncharacterized membrane protein HdeD (DUF308 family)
MNQGGVVKNGNRTGVISNFHEIDEVRNHWGRFLALGIVMAILGCFAIGSSVTVTMFSVVVTGFLLLAAGLVQIAHGFWARQWKGMFLSMLLGVLYIVTGFLCLTNPAASAVSVTLLIGAFCLAAGMFRMIWTLFHRFYHWGWIFFNGLVTFILGLLIVNQWPVSGLWIIGLFIGIDILLAGVSLIFLSLSARR